MKYTMPRHAPHPEDLPDGRVVGPGDEVEITKEEVKDPRIEQLIEDGLLEAVETKSSSSRAKGAEKVGE